MLSRIFYLDFEKSELKNILDKEDKSVVRSILIDLDNPFHIFNAGLRIQNQYIPPHRILKIETQS